MADLLTAACAILERTPVPGLLLDATGKILAVNPTFSSQTGYLATDLARRTWLRHMLPSSSERTHALQLYRQARHGHSSTSRPWVLQGRDGALQPRVSTLIPLDREHGFTMVWLTHPSPAQEVSLRLVTAAYLDDRAHLAAGLAHFLGNHLLGMKFEVHQARAAMESPEDFETSMKALESALHEGQALIERIRILDRPAPLRDRTRDPSGLLLEVAGCLARERDLDPDAVFLDRRETDRPLEVKDTPLRIAITEIVQNALDATDLDATGSDRKITLGATIRGDRYILWVTNEGVALAPEVLAGARQPFFTTRSHRAAGLGLCIAERAMESLHGTLWFGPRPGGGARVELSLPTGAQASGDGPVILVLDGEMATRNQICHQLNRAGYRCEHGPVPLEDLSDLLTDRHPDLILLGRASRGNEGIPFTAHLRELYPGIPLLLLGTSSHSSRDPAKTVPPATIVSRHDIDALMEAIQTALARSSRRRGSGR